MPFFTLTIEDFSPFITYSGTDWDIGASTDPFASRYSQSTFRATNKGGANAKIAFNGTGITIYGAKRPNHGLYRVNLDGVDNSPVNGSNTPELFSQALFTASNLDQGPHTVQITNQNNGLYLDIDYITIDGNVGENSNGKLYAVNYQDSDASFSYLPSESQWSTNPDNLGTFFGSSGHSTTSSGASFDFSFNGDGVSLYGPLASNGAPYTVSLDGAQPITLQSSYSRYLPQSLLYHATNIGGGQHHLKVTYAPNGNNQGFAVDYANVYTTNSGSSTSSGGASSNSDSGLSAGAAAGITLAAAVIVALLVVLGLLFTKRRRERKAEQEVEKNHTTVNPYLNGGASSQQATLGTPSTYPSQLPGTFTSGVAPAGFPVAAAAGYASGSTSSLGGQRHRNLPSDSNASSSDPSRHFTNTASPGSDGAIVDMYGDVASPAEMRKLRANAARPPNEISPPGYTQ